MNKIFRTFAKLSIMLFGIVGGMHINAVNYGMFKSVKDDVFSGTKVIEEEKGISVFHGIAFNLGYEYAPEDHVTFRILSEVKYLANTIYDNNDHEIHINQKERFNLGLKASCIFNIKKFKYCQSGFNIGYYRSCLKYNTLAIDLVGLIKPISKLQIEFALCYNITPISATKASNRKSYVLNAIVKVGLLYSFKLKNPNHGILVGGGYSAHFDMNTNKGYIGA